MLTNEERLTNQVRNWARPMAESILGLKDIFEKRIPYLDEVEIEPSGDIIDDGEEAQLPFTNADFVAWRNLVHVLISGLSDPTINAVLQTLSVRPVDVIVQTMTKAPDYDPTLSPEANALRSHIRPFAPILRKIRRKIQDGERVIPKLLALSGLSGDAVIDERPAEDVDGVTVGQLNTLFQFFAIMTGPGVNSEDVATATDAACILPLE